MPHRSPVRPPLPYRVALPLAAAIAIGLGNNRAAAQTAANVLVVVNSGSATSEAVAHHYIGKRGIPQDNVCRITAPTTETIARPVYDNAIELPIWRCLAAARAQDRILYIVLTKDVPIRIMGTGGRTGTVASVDSELTLLYRRKTGQEVPVVGFVPNPYFAGPSNAAVQPFTHTNYDIYLVTRLDGYTQRDAEAVIDRGDAPTSDGHFVLDERAALVDSGGDAWLRTAAERLRAAGMGDRVVLDETTTVVTQQKNVLGYYSWGSNDPAFRQRHYGFEFVPGALAATFVSTDGRTLKEPPAEWSPANVATRQAIYAGSHQSMAADFIRDGATGIAAHVNEPYLDATIRPDILFPAYVSGRNLAEAFYAAMPYLSWQTIVIGDPLCAPFQKKPVTSDDLNPIIDTATELPAAFAKRRLSVIAPSIKRDAAAAYARYESRRDRKDDAGARQALETAVIADPVFITARFTLAQAQESDKQYDRAIANYEAIVKYRPNDSISLNNLAYLIATERGKPEEALPYAERAATIARSSPVILDTYAWVQHLAGQHQSAAATMRRVLATGVREPEILLHAAIIDAAANDFARAAAELDAAVKADPGMADRDEVKKLRQQLPGAK